MKRKVGFHSVVIKQALAEWLERRDKDFPTAFEEAQIKLGDQVIVMSWEEPDNANT